jgi:hypothetical protein
MDKAGIRSIEVSRADVELMQNVRATVAVHLKESSAVISRGPNLDDPNEPADKEFVDALVEMMKKGKPNVK